MKPNKEFSCVTISKSSTLDDLYYINTVPVFAGNWSISKEKFSMEEQKSFENYIKAINNE